MPSRSPPRDADAEKMKSIKTSAQRASVPLKAFSHETRLLILYILAEGERTVTEIEDLLGLQQAVVSQHLARLRMDRLVQTRRDGRLIRYRLVSDEIRTVIALLLETFGKEG